jgi:hypothetical protein
MNTNTPPVIRGEFIYHNVLLVDAGGDLKRHPRASLGDIKTLLDGKTPKDQVAHFYEAQLIHYGLQRSKDKNTAKVRLQQALNQKKLVVPPHIIDMEAQMKKDFAASVRKANKSAAGKTADTTTPSGGAASSKKRKQSGEEETPAASSKKTKITMKVGDIEFSIDHDSNEIASVISKKKATASTKTTATPKSKATPAPAAKQPKTPQAKKAAPQTDTKAKPTTKKATEAQAKSTATEKVTKTANKPKAEKPTVVKKETKVKKEPTSTQATPKAKAKNIKQEQAIKREPSLDEEPFTPGIHNLTGVWNVSCPQLEDQSPEHIGTLRLFLCVDSHAGKIWGGFELGWKSGVVLIADYSGAPDATMSFGWRSRDSRRGGLDFGRNCHGQIEFVGGGKLGGTFFNLFPERVDFEAERRPGPLWCGRDAWQFEQEWDGFVAEAYGR